MKKILKIMFIVSLMIGVIGIPHIHDDQCGYNPETGEGCIYEYEIAPLQNNGPID